jgi:hypothetical protein
VAEAIVRDRHVRQAQAVVDMTEVEAAEIAAVSHRANPIIVATAAADRTRALATTMMNVATSPATHLPASPAASDQMRTPVTDNS